MHAAQMAIQQLAVALGHWRDLGAHPSQHLSTNAVCLDAAVHRIAQAPCPGRVAVVSASPPLLQAIRRRLALGRGALSSASLGSAPWPLPACLSLDDSLEQAIIRRARGPADVPRSQQARVSELAGAVASSPVLSAGLAPTARSAWQLASEWAALFDRWDWLTAAWSQGGEPDAQPVDLSDVSLLGTLYEACWDNNDPAAWFASHPPREDEAQDILWCGVHPADPLDQARLAVAWPGRWQAVAVEPNQQAGLLAVAWPDIHDLQAGRSPQPADWDPPALRSHQLLASLDAGALMLDCTCLEGARMEACAGLAVETLLAWLRQGRAALGVIPADRQMARRVAAGLSAHGIFIDDLSGWSLDTTLAATAFDGWLDLLLHRITRDRFLGWVQSPLVIAALERTGLMQADAAEAIDRRLRRQPSGRLNLEAVCPALSSPCRRWSEALAQAGTMGAWLACIQDSLRETGLEAVLLEDAAGLRLISGMAQLAVALSDEPVTVANTQAALADTLRQARLPIRADGAPIRMLSLAEAALSEIDGLVLLGASDGRFPARPPNRLVTRSRRDLLFCLPEQALEQARFVSNLAEVLARGVPVVAIAQRDAEDQPATWASALARLHLVAPSTRPRLAHPLAATHLLPLPPPTPPAVMLAGLPSEVSVSTLQSLASCPYRFHWQAVLGLSPLSPLKDLSGPPDLGLLLHRLSEAVGDPALQAPRDSEAASPQAWLDWLEATLRRMAQGRGWSADLLAQARPLLPGFAQWLAEAASSHNLIGLEQEWLADLPKSRVRLRGRSDRLDADQETGGLRLVDLKITSADTLRARLRRDSGALQIEAYSWLLDAAGMGRPREQGCLSVSWSGARWVPCDHRPELMTTADEALARLAQGEAVRALAGEGDGTDCEHCPAKGCCRVQDWGTV
ncbi:MAG: PD-(D/E)XK nuclease family protein [Burkholderiaceae bacterium]